MRDPKTKSVSLTVKPTEAGEEELSEKDREMLKRLLSVRWPMAPDETDESSPT